MTPPGDNRCPLCRAALWAPDPGVIDSKTCPRCGADLWVLEGRGGSMFFLRRPGQSRYGFLAALLAPLNGLSTDEMEVLLKGADTLDLIEMVLDAEDALRSVRR